MKRNRVSKYVLGVSIFSLVVILVVIIQASYNNLIGQSAKIDASPGKSIDPKLNTSVIDEIIKREIFDISPTTTP